MATITQNRELLVIGEYDIIVCGGGLSGIIAALAAAQTSEKFAVQTSERAVAQTSGKVVEQTSEKAGAQENEKAACMGIGQVTGAAATQANGEAFEINEPKLGYEDINEISRSNPRLSGSFGGFVRLLVKS